MILIPLTERADTDEKKRILIIEDSPETQLMFKTYLKSHYHVSAAADADEGIKKLKSEPYDLLLLDLNLPGDLNGNDVLQKIRTEMQLTEFPVIIVTAFALKGDKEKYIADGANDFLPKPVEKKLLLDKIKEYTRD